MIFNISENNMILLNEIIYSIYSIRDTDKMRAIFLDLLKNIIPYERAAFYLADTETGYYQKNPIGVGFREEDLLRYISEFAEIDLLNWVFRAKQCEVYRHTDLYPEELRTNSEYYKTAYAPLSIHFSVIVSLAYEEVFLGSIGLYRSKENHDFSDQDLKILMGLKKHIALRLYNDISSNQINSSRSAYKGKIYTRYKEYNLTQREREILALLIKGEQNNVICEQLFISYSTLRKHTSNIYKKTGVKNRVDLVKKMLSE